MEFIKHFDLLGTIGFVLTIYGLYLAFRFRSKTQIKYFQHENISLLGSRKDIFSDIKILHKNQEIADNIILYRASIINTGSNDIDKSIAYEPLKLELPNIFQIIDFRIISSSDGVNSKSSFDNHNAEINWDLLKIREYIKFECIIEYKSNGKGFEDSQRLLRQGITFSHRIKNLKTINRLKIDDFTTSNKGRIAIIIFQFLVASFLTLSFLAGLFTSKQKVELRYVTPSNELVKDIQAFDSATIKFKTINNEEVSVELNKNPYFKLRPYVIAQKVNWDKYLAMLFLFGGTLFMYRGIYLNILEFRNKEIISKLLKEDK